MKFSLLLIATFISSFTLLKAQVDQVSFDAETNADPLYVFLENEDNNIERYLLEKKNLISPDSYSDNPIGLSLSHFKNIDLKNTINNCSFFELNNQQFNAAWGLTFNKTPELSFFEDRLYKVKFFLDKTQLSQTTTLKKLNNKFGKPQKRKYNLNNTTIKEYTWEGYKVNISFLLFEQEGSTESVIVVEDELVGQLAIADQENKTFVKEAKLYSDIETLMRYK